ncbi:MAG: hypothetical protein EA420_03430 [Candidatus Competibacteraceae bacterium]|nr:MAG: hypothetical protein EA420_03430 [Candidatus Competibacteraceae bacterium]
MVTDPATLEHIQGKIISLQAAVEHIERLMVQRLEVTERALAEHEVECRARATETDSRFRDARIKPGYVISTVSIVVAIVVGMLSWTLNEVRSTDVRMTELSKDVASLLAGTTAATADRWRRADAMDAHAQRQMEMVQMEARLRDEMSRMQQRLGNHEQIAEINRRIDNLLPRMRRLERGEDPQE